MTIAAACLLSASLCVNAGDLEVDNLTLYGKLEFANQFANEGDGTATGGTITNYTLDGTNYTAHIFTDVGESNFIITGSGSLTCEVFVVAGGGGGASMDGGGGGAGGYVALTNIYSTGSYSVVVGAGGEEDQNGSNSVFGTNVAIGGGCWCAAGGSGGGGCSDDEGEGSESYPGGAGTPGQGHDGGDGGPVGPNNNAGGGGAGGDGADAPGAGGIGIYSDISGVNTLYASGGSGTGNSPGAANTGNGADGDGYGEYYDCVGGSGIVIVRYLNTSTNVTASIHGINQNSASATNIFLGKVGIGTNSPAEKLHIDGNVRVDGSFVLSTPAGNLPMGVFTNQ